MKITILTTLFVTALLLSSQTIASPDSDILDEITIRVLDSENMSSNVTKIALPNIAGDHGVEHPDAADNANHHAAEAG
ncbi:MAG: hypothetical protein ACYST9_04570, partial [Planctomycetota bacterium]